MLRKFAKLPPLIKYAGIASVVVALTFSAYGMAMVFAEILPDTAPPAVTGSSVDNAVISPNGDGIKEIAYVTYTIDEPADVKLQVYDSANSLVYEGLPVALDAAGTYSNLTWEGTGGVDEQSYRLVIWARDRSPDANTGTTEVGDSNAADVTVDLAGPVFSSIQATNITETSATVTWTTNEAATSKVEYRKIGDTAWRATNQDATPVTGHNVVVAGLTGDTTYEYRVISVDSVGNSAASSINTFKTLLPDTTAPTFSVAYFTSSNLVEGTELPLKNGLPVTKAQTVYLQITPNESLNGAPTVDITDGQDGINGNEYYNAATEPVSGNIYRYRWNVGDFGDREFVVNLTGTDVKGNTASNVRPVEGDRVVLDTAVSSPTLLPGEDGPGFVKLSWNDSEADLARFKIYRSISGGFTPDDATNLLITLYANNFTYVDGTATYPNTYFYKIFAVDIAGNVSVPSGEINGTPAKVNPHSNYDSNTRMCAECHSGHAADGKDLLSESDAKTTCYLCHSPGGQSQYDVQTALKQSGSRHPVEMESTNPGHTQLAGDLSCENCHNPHGDIKTPPSIYYAKLLRSKDSAGTYRDGNEYCFACHGDAVNSPAYLGNKEENYPASGSGHNKSDWTASNGQKPFNLMGNGVSCYGCHDTHGSTLGNLLKAGVDYSNDNTPTTANDKNFCYDCHTADPGNTANTWAGNAVYENRGHGAPRESGVLECQVCHDPHGTPNGKNLKKSYDLASGPTRNKPYSANDYSLCFTCHPESEIFDTSNPPKQTGFSDKVSGRNLHKLHVKDRTDITCRECHRPHGADPSEQSGSTTVHQVGWPDRNTVNPSASLGAGPFFSNNPGGISGGSCALSCHGKDHDGSSQFTYDNTQINGIPGGGDSGCYYCHASSGTGPDIKSLMGEGNTGGKAFKHKVSNVMGNAAEGNQCFLCHEPHSSYDGIAKAKNAKFMDWEATSKVLFNDYKLCQNCHNQTPSPGAAAINSSYTSTAHSFDSQPVYHDYSDSDFKGNCVKCHNPHGSDTPFMLEMKSTAGDGKSGAVTSQSLAGYGSDANVVCKNCHSGAGSGNSAKWPGTVLYNKTAHKTVPNPADGKHGSGTGLCITCHDPHGKTDGQGLIPDLLSLRGKGLCDRCHTGASGKWPGTVVYNSSAHGSNNGGTCTVCHNPHGKDDGTGNPYPSLVNGPLPETCWSSSGCHGTSSAKDIQTPYSYSGAYASSHNDCQSCHNNHEAKAGTGFSGALKGTTGVNISSWPAAKTAAEGGGYASIPGSSWTTVTDSQMISEWQLCFKCHSSNASNTGVTGAADVSVYHNPNNISSHGFEGPGTDSNGDGVPDNGMNAIIYKFRTDGPVLNGTYDSNRAMLLEPWNTTLKTTCSDCHGNSNTAGAKGPHGSNYQYVLKWDFRTTAACLKCHNGQMYDYPSLASNIDNNKQSNGYEAHRRSNHFDTFSNTDFNDKFGSNNCRLCHYGRGSTFTNSSGASLHGANIKLDGSLNAGNGGLSDRGMNGFSVKDILLSGGQLAKPELEGGATKSGSCDAGACHGGKNY